MNIKIENIYKSIVNLFKNNKQLLKMREVAVRFVKRSRNIIFRYRMIFISVVTVIILFFFVVFIVPKLQNLLFFAGEASLNNTSELIEQKLVKKERNLDKELIRLQQQIISMTPYNSYLIINSTENKFFLYRNRKLIRKGVCSTGSYILLEYNDKQKWLFKTPRGEHRVQGKITSPVWYKPNWAFIEEGLPVPPKYHYSRYEAGVLGDYALSLGHGYLIHGTLYKRMMGMPVTHGCIRLNDEDLEIVYTTLSIGSKVFIY